MPIFALTSEKFFRDFISECNANARLVDSLFGPRCGGENLKFRAADSPFTRAMLRINVLTRPRDNGNSVTLGISGKAVERSTFGRVRAIKFIGQRSVEHANLGPGDSQS